MALEASSGSQDEQHVDWDAPLSINAPGSTTTGAVATSDGSSAAAVTAPSRRIAQDAMSLAADETGVRHGKCELAAIWSLCFCIYPCCSYSSIVKAPQTWLKPIHAACVLGTQ